MKRVFIILALSFILPLTACHYKEEVTENENGENINLVTDSGQETLDEEDMDDTIVTTPATTPTNQIEVEVEPRSCLRDSH